MSRRTSQRQQEKAPEGRAPHSAIDGAADAEAPEADASMVRAPLRMGMKLARLLTVDFTRVGEHNIVYYDAVSLLLGRPALSQRQDNRTTHGRS
jgi:hypothetical protein